MLRKFLPIVLLFCLFCLCGCESYTDTTASRVLANSAGTTLGENSMPASTDTTANPTQPGHIHSYVAEVINPGCDTEGYLLHLCGCGHSFMDEVVPPLGHSWGAWQTVQSPTTESTGLQQRSCSQCGTVETKVLEKLEPGHSHQYTEEIIAPTCLTEGYTYHSCSCGDGYGDNYIQPLGHAFSEFTSNEDATCTEDGTLVAVCNRCGISERVVEVGSALGHLWSEWIIEKEPTVAEEGRKIRNCDRCGATDAVVLDRLPEEHSHEYKKEKVAPTCTEGGYNLYVCACGESYREETSQPKGHTWGPWLVSIQPTTMSEGEKFRACQDCDQKEWAALEKLPNEESFVFVSWSEKVGRNEDAHVTIQGKPGVEYSITVFYKSGPSSAKGLEPKVADENGYVTWTWKVGGRTALGTFEIVVAGGGETRSIYFTIEE